MIEVKNRYTNTSTGYVKLYLSDGSVVDEHRHTMEAVLGRKLNYNEVIHHEDGDKQNNGTDNLSVMSRSDHARLHSSTGRTMVDLVCASCSNDFEREMRQVTSKINSGQSDFYCSRKCASSSFGHGRSNKISMVSNVMVA